MNYSQMAQKKKNQRKQNEEKFDPEIKICDSY